jgi:phospholipid:diacylglycerol acyltransferase
LLEGLRKNPRASLHVPVQQRRRIFFFGGSLLGALLAYLVFLNTTDYHGAFLSDIESRFNKLDLGFPTPQWGDIGEMINMPDLIGPQARKWLENRDFKVGREAKEAGYEKTHAIMLIPGVISSGLESWGTDAETAQFFRKRLWGGGSMVQSIVTRKAEWIKAMSLDTKSGLDPPNVKVRSAQGLDAASYFITGYWIWSKIIENLAAIDYDYNDLTLQAYDWRLSYINLQYRDAYFSRIKGVIEHSLAVNGKKTVLVSHSMGGTVTLWFLKWVEAKGYGNGGSDWAEKHIEGWVNIAGCLLGVPKAMAAFMSGEVSPFLSIFRVPG